MSKIEVQLNPDTPPTGSDLSVVNAARRSFNTRSELGTDGKLLEKDKRLIEFLARGMTASDFDNFLLTLDRGTIFSVTERDDVVEKLWQWRNTPTHDTPFNHTFISFEVKAPIFVRAQLVKHEYLIMSEFSRRYITDGIEFYEPDYWRKAAPNKKQGSLEEAVDTPCSKFFGLYGPCNDWSEGEALRAYKLMIEKGVAPEQARMVLPQSTMTEWTWSGTLGAFAKMCQLRLHPEAQYEARIVAQEVYKYLKEYWPVSAPALVEGVS